MNRLLALASLVILGITLYINYLAGTGGINNIGTGEVSGMYPTLFTPAGFTFAIWSVIYLFNTAFVIYNVVLAFSKPEKFQQKLIGLFTLVCIVNSSWIFAWHYDQILVSVFLMLIILFLLITSFRISRQLEGKGFGEFLAKTNFGIYMGWISVATVANVSIMIAGKGANSWNNTDLVWTWVVIGVAVLLAIWIVTRFKSFAYALVIAWALYGIYSARMGQLNDISFKVADAALLGLVLVLVTSGYVFTRKMISLRS